MIPLDGARRIELQIADVPNHVDDRCSARRREQLPCDGYAARVLGGESFMELRRLSRQTVWHSATVRDLLRTEPLRQAPRRAGDPRARARRRARLGEDAVDTEHLRLPVEGRLDPPDDVGLRAGSAGRSSRTRASPSARTSRAGRRKSHSASARSRSWTRRSNGERNVMRVPTGRPGLGVSDEASLLAAGRRARGSASRRGAAALRPAAPSPFSGYQRSARSHSRWPDCRPATATRPRVWRSSSIHIRWARVPHQT